MNDGMYRVVSGGLWRDPTWKFDNDLGPGLQEVIQPGNIFPHESIVERLRELSDEHERVRSDLDRRITLHTGPAGMEQFNQAMRNLVNDEIGNSRSLGEVFNQAAPFTNSSGLGTIQVYGTGGIEPSYTDFDRSIPDTLVMPEDIMNSNSITTTRHFETEEEAINYLDSLSNDI